MKKRLCILFFVFVILGCLAYFAYDYATDYVVKKTLIMVREDAELQSQIEAVLNQIQPSPSPTIQEENTVATEEEAGKALPQTPPQNSNTPSPNPSVATPDGKLSIDDLQPSDKDYVMSIYKRFSASEINQVTNMLTNGITPEEKQAIKAIVYAKVTREEVKTLYAIAKKYS